MPDVLRLDLLENAYDYLNAALEHLVSARRSREQRHWKFALLNLTICIELLLKERLKREHPLLIYADIDRFRPITRSTKTAPFSVVVERLRYALGERFEALDKGRTALAQALRNQILHYDVKLVFPDAYHDFANLLNFVVRLFESEIRGSSPKTLYDIVDRQLWLEEDGLAEAFREEIVYYNAIFMAKSLKEEIVAEQSRDTLLREGLPVNRIPYGAPQEWPDMGPEYARDPCGDCSAARGQIHLHGCDIERCPVCGGQLISCGCSLEYPYEEE